MSTRDSSSRDSGSHHRRQNYSLSAPASVAEIDLVPSGFASVHTSGYQQQALSRGSNSTWPLRTSVQSLAADAQFTQAYPIPSSSDILSLPLNTSASLATTILNPDTPLPSLESEQSLGSVNHEERLIKESSQGLGTISYRMSVASGAYFAGPMQPENYPYSWNHRPFQPPQPPAGNMNQQFPSSHQYPPAGFPVGYHNPPTGSLPSYQLEPQPPPSYVPTALGIAPRQSQAQSPPMAPVARSFYPHSAPAATLPNQSIMTPPSHYMINQPAYLVPEAQPIPSSHSSSLSPQASSVPAEPVFPSPAAIPIRDPKDRALHVSNSRPRPQCWDHGCDGREFSTFSNLLRHQREKSGVVAKAECPVCGAVFTRTTARNIHVAQGKCKGPGRNSPAE